MISIRRLRLATGLVLFTYVTLHLVNHTLGLVSLDAMLLGGEISEGLWGNPLGLVLLYGSMAIHMGLAFQSLYQRRSLKMPPAEWVQLLLGLSIPPLLAIHLISMRGGAALYGIDGDYRSLQTIFWHAGEPWQAIKQVAGLLAAWTHGCIGVYFWLRLKAGFTPWRTLYFSSVVGLAIAALSGFIASGREVQLRIAANPDWADRALQPLQAASPSELASLSRFDGYFLAAFGLVLAATLTARLLRLLWEQRAGRVRIHYQGARSVTAAPGSSILEISRAAGIPHASVCGGRGRCSTCRVRVEADENALEPPSDEEMRVLERIKAPEGVRLACQTRPRGDLKVTLLLPPHLGPRDRAARDGFRQGEERSIAVLFADLRGFTSLSESKLPYDVVFLLNRFAREMGEAIEAAGGRIDKFMGDGVMALFGIDSSGQEGARQALAAASDMQARLEALNASLAGELPVPLRMGIGIHAGPVIVGEIGHGQASGITAVGDVVNTASRLEAMTKELGATLVVSESLIELAGVQEPEGEQHRITVRGRSNHLLVRAVGTPP